MERSPIAEDARRACEDLILAFCDHIDHGQPLKAADLFTVDGSFDRRGETLRGRAALIEALGRRPAGIVTRHVCSNIRLQADGADRIAGTTTFLFFRRTEAAGPAGAPPADCLEVVGEYHDVFVRTADGWRIADRRAVPVFQRPA